MRTTTSFRTTLSRLAAASARTAGTDRGWHNVTDRDADRVAFQVTTMAQMRTWAR